METHKSIGAKKNSPTSPKSPASPKSPKSPKSPDLLAPHTVVLQPGEHWTAAPGDDDDACSDIGSDAASSTASISTSILAYRTVNGRTYHSDRGSTEYWGPNDELSIENMDIQHHVWTLVTGGKLYRAPIDKTKTQKAIDIGTGSGLWAMDFADEHPQCTVIGTDLSPIQPNWLPPNARFEVEDFTCEWTFEPNSMDYIHMRWICGCVPDWDFIMTQAFRCLKPGGWIESMEIDGAFECDDGTMPEKSALGQFGALFTSFGNGLATPMSFLVVSEGTQRKTMDAAGFINIQEHPFKVPTGAWPQDPELRRIGEFQAAAILADPEGLVTYPATANGWTQQQIGVYAAYLRKELKSKKIHAYIKSNTVIGQKPL